jgi:RHS repeat-associated protein
VFFDDLIITHTKGKVLQKDHYYPFGLNISALSSTAPLSKPNKYKFNGNEEQTEFDLNLYDFNARMYDATLGRFNSVDPLADDRNQLGQSPYQFGWNNPSNLSDPSGECPWCLGALIGAVVDIAVQTIEITLDDNKTFDDFSLTSVGVSALAGATGVGLATKLKRVGKVGQLVIESTLDAVASSGTQLAKDGKVDFGDVIIDVIGGQTAGKVAGDFAESKFLKSNNGKNLQEGINQQKNAERGKSNLISKSNADVKGAENKLTRAQAARGVGASAAATGASSTAIAEIDKKLKNEENN